MLPIACQKSEAFFLLRCSLAQAFRPENSAATSSPALLLLSCTGRSSLSPISFSIVFVKVSLGFATVPNSCSARRFSMAIMLSALPKNRSCASRVIMASIFTGSCGAYARLSG